MVDIQATTSMPLNARWEEIPQSIWAGSSTPQRLNLSQELFKKAQHASSSLALNEQCCRVFQMSCFIAGPVTEFPHPLAAIAEDQWEAESQQP